jgi:hypothetical protein
MTSNNHNNYISGQLKSAKFSLQLTYCTDLTVLTSKLQQANARSPIREAEIRIDPSFLLRVTTIDVSWRYGVLESLANGMPHLQKLTIWGPYNASVPLPILSLLLNAQGCNSSLTHLSFNQLKFSGNRDDFLEFVEVIDRYYGSLEEFRISAVRFLGEENIDAEEERLMQALSILPKLKLVAITGTNIVDLSKILKSPSIEALCSAVMLQKLILFSLVLPDEESSHALRALQNNRTIQEASLGLTCGTLGGPALSHMLQHNATLDKLWVRVTSLEDEKGTHAIAEALRTASHLKEFGLYGEGYTSDKSQGFFVDMLRHDNTRLHVLELQASSSVNSEEMHFYLSLNEIGRHQLLQHDSDREQWVRSLVLACSRHDISCIFYLLNTNPALCDAVEQVNTNGRGQTTRA